MTSSLQQRQRAAGGRIDRRRVRRRQPGPHCGCVIHQQEPRGALGGRNIEARQRVAPDRLCTITAYNKCGSATFAGKRAAPRDLWRAVAPCDRAARRTMVAGRLAHETTEGDENKREQRGADESNSNLN